MSVQEHVQAIGKLMVQILARSLKAGTIPLARAQEIGRFYLDKLKIVQTEEELQQDLKEMADTIPEMKTVIELENAKSKEAHEQQLRQQADELLKQGKIEEAAALAKQIK